MRTIALFNKLDGNIVSRTKIEKLQRLAAREKALEVVTRLGKLLDAYPDEETFEITLTKKIQQPALGAPNSDVCENRVKCTGIKKDGTLRKGYLYGKNGVVKKYRKPKAKSALGSPNSEICENRVKCTGIKKDGTLRKGYLYGKNGVVKKYRKPKAEATKKTATKTTAKKKVATIVKPEKTPKPAQRPKTSPKKKAQPHKPVAKKPASRSKPEKKIAKPKPEKPASQPTAKVARNFVQIPLNHIHIDEKRFQNRKKLNETILQSIVDNWNPDKLDPVKVWKDPSDKKTYLLAGHHRYEGGRRRGEKTIAAQYFRGTEKEAIQFAKVESNANRSLETPLERSNIYRIMRENGEPKATIDKQAKIEGKNKNYILNLSHLNEKGRVIESLERLQESPDVQNGQIIERVADWIGEARKTYPVLTDSHETEMFKFLMDDEQSKRIRTKADFLQKIYAVAGAFTFDDSQPLNLQRLKYKSEGEKAYEEAYDQLKTEISTRQDKISAIKERFINPQANNYVAPDTPDYESLKQSADTVIAGYNAEIKELQRKLIDLQQNKGKFTRKGIEQAALFGAARKKRKKKPGKRKTKKPHVITLAMPAEPIPYIESEPKTDNSGSIHGGEAPEPVLAKETTSKRRFITVAERLKQAQQSPPEVYNLNNREIVAFLGNPEIKETGSVVITIAGPKGSGKTRFGYQLLNAFAEAGYKCGHASLEEEPDSMLYTQKATEYFSDKATKNIEAPHLERDNISEMDVLIEGNEVILIDSFKKLRQYLPRFDMDNDLRKKYNGKLFIIIFQLTSDGKMRGGSDAEYDGDIILFSNGNTNYKENYIYAEKNRYQAKPLNELAYNIYRQETCNPQVPVAPERITMEI